MRKIIFLIGAIVFLSSTAYPCFDTYLFLKRASMVYPFKSLVFELSSEYSINSIKSPYEDSFLSLGSLYYGLFRNFSVQFSVGSDEKSRDLFKVDYYAVRGVYNIYSSFMNRYTLDIIFEHRGKLDERNNEVEISLPNIFNISNATYVIHPVLSYGLDSKDLTIGGHAGVFYIFNEIALIGAGFEYASVHSSSYAGRRLTRSEYSMSLFLGSKIGDRFYLQNEIAKGLANSRDFGFALTAKVIL